MVIVTVGRNNFVTFAKPAGTADAAVARTDLRALADGQAALRRVAELVAHGAALRDVFQEVTTETAKLVGSSHASLHRHACDGTATTVATYDAGHATMPNTGMELAFPVVVDGRTWGVLTTSISGSLVSHRSDLSIPVNLRMTAPRLPGQIETTVYFFVAEALTNVVKHAQAKHAEVTVEIDGATLWAEVRDDDIGGADPAGGSGLTGLSDRIQAVDGTLTCTSTAGSGTVVHILLPLGESGPDPSPALSLPEALGS